MAGRGKRLEEEDLGYAAEWDRWAALTAGLAICAVSQEPFPGQNIWIDVGKLATRLGLDEVTLIAMWRTLSLNAVAMLTPNVKGRHKRKDPFFLEMAELHESGLRALQTWDREVSIPLSLYRPYVTDSLGELKGINYRDVFRNSRYGQETREDLLKLLHESRDIAKLRILQQVIAHSFDAPTSSGALSRSS